MGPIDGEIDGEPDSQIWSHLLIRELKVARGKDSHSHALSQTARLNTSSPLPSIQASQNPPFLALFSSIIHRRPDRFHLHSLQRRRCVVLFN